MKIIVTIATIDPHHGGPARTVPALCRALVNQSADVELVTIAEGGKKGSDLGIGDGLKATIIETAATRYHPRSWAKQFKEALRDAVKEAKSIIYDVGLWL